MKIKIQKLLDIKESLQKLVNLDVPIKTAFKLSKAIKDFNKEYEAYEDSRKKLFDKYGKENDDGNTEITEKNMEVFKKEIDALMEITVNIKFPEITLKDLGNIKFSALDMANLDILIRG